MHFYYYYCAPLFLLLLLVTPAKAFVRQQQLSPICSAVVSSLAAAGGMNARELEIRKKIAALRKEGKLTKTPSDNALINDNKANTKNLKGDYEAKIRNKLGNKRSKLLGYGSTSDYGGTQETTLDSVDQEMLEQDLVESQEEAIGSAVGSTLRLGGLTSESALFEASEASSVQQNPARKPIINPDLFDNAEDEEEEMNEVDMIKLVEKGLAQKKALELELEEAKRKERALEQLRQPPVFAKQNGGQQPTMTTTGIGGSYTANETARSDMYQPKVGSWGAFPRPRDISKAYGGGRLVAPGYYSEAERQASDERTRARLKEYLVSAGIDVQSEKDHASEINEALAIGARAMERGLYNTAVSALEKVTKYCSSNSPVGGKVYLELAMAYDSAGQKEQAILVYKTLTKSRTDKIKTDAKRLLYGIEAIRFMQDDIKSKEFSRQAAVSPFIDLMQIDLFNDNFDNKYYHSYVDLEKDFYKRISENVVRSGSEARQVLLQATNSGEVNRLRIVQALGFISRRFSDALKIEIDQNAPLKETGLVIDGKPIFLSRPVIKQDTVSESDDFALADADTMRENLNGDWRLQLLADKEGDGVQFFNKTDAIQSIDVESMSFSSSGPSGFVTVRQNGMIKFNLKKRVLRRLSVEVTSGGIFTSLFGRRSGAVGAVRAPQQVMAVDSVLMITRHVPHRRKPNNDDEKEYFAVWRRVDPDMQQP